MESISKLPPVAGPIIAAAYQILTQYDTESFPPVGVTLNTTTGRFSFGEPGKYEVLLAYSFGHDAVAASRLHSFRLFNETQSAAVQTMTYGSEGNADYTQGHFTLQFEVTDAADVYRLEVGNAATNYTTVQHNTLSLTLKRLSEHGAL